MRQVLAEQRAFEPYTAFRRIDRNRNGFLTITDLEKFLLENDIVLTYRDLFAIHKNFDINGDGRINYSEYLYYLYISIRFLFLFLYKFLMQ